jgi:hypothetical protein
MATNNSEHVVVVGNNEQGFMAIGQDVTTEIGEIKDVTQRRWIRNTYPSNYNHAVANANDMTKINGNDTILFKKSMHGGRFFLNRVVVFLAFSCIAGYSGDTSNITKDVGAVSIALSAIYIVLLNQSTTLTS